MDIKSWKCRVIINSKHCQHAVRTVAQRGRAVRHLGVLFAGAGVVRLHRNGDFVNHRRHFGCRFPARLAGFRRDDARQFGLICLQQPGKLFNKRLAHGERLFCPRRERAASGMAGLFHLRGAGVMPLPEHLFSNRIGLYALFAFARDPVTVNP